jgi:hypothetical protein
MFPSSHKFYPGAGATISTGPSRPTQMDAMALRCRFRGWILSSTLELSGELHRLSRGVEGLSPANATPDKRCPSHVYSPVDPSICSRNMSACPAWRAVSSIMWMRMYRRL